MTEGTTRSGISLCELLCVVDCGLHWQSGSFDVFEHCKSERFSRDTRVSAIHLHGFSRIRLNLETTQSGKTNTHQNIILTANVPRQSSEAHQRRGIYALLRHRRRKPPGIACPLAHPLSLVSSVSSWLLDLSNQRQIWQLAALYR